jgi:hypothetical protein
MSVYSHARKFELTIWEKIREITEVLAEIEDDVEIVKIKGCLNEMKDELISYFGKPNVKKLGTEKVSTRKTAYACFSESIRQRLKDDANYRAEFIAALKRSGVEDAAFLKKDGSPTLPLGPTTKRISALWKALSEDETKEWQDAADELNSQSLDVFLQDIHNGEAPDAEPKERKPKEKAAKDKKPKEKKEKAPKEKKEKAPKAETKPVAEEKAAAMTDAEEEDAPVIKGDETDVDVEEGGADEEKKTDLDDEQLEKLKKKYTKLMAKCAESDGLVILEERHFRLEKDNSGAPLLVEHHGDKKTTIAKPYTQEYFDLFCGKSKKSK